MDKSLKQEVKLLATRILMKQRCQSGKRDNPFTSIMLGFSFGVL